MASVPGIELQWGRDLSIAEFSFSVALPTRRNLLQWGRDLSIAEFLIPPSPTSQAIKLQWGRDLSIAELPPAA